MEQRLVPGQAKSDSSKILEVVGVGGTFDILHSGHETLLRAALHSARKVQIGLSSDRFVERMKKTHKVNPYDVRAQEIRRFLKREHALDRTEIVPIDDEYGPATWSPDLEGLVVSRQTLPNGEKINKIRQKAGLPRLKLLVVELVLAEDGKPISTRRIRGGEITATGKTITRS